MVSKWGHINTPTWSDFMPTWAGTSTTPCHATGDANHNIQRGRTNAHRLVGRKSCTRQRRNANIVGGNAVPSSGQERCVLTSCNMECIDHNKQMDKQRVRRMHRTICQLVIYLVQAFRVILIGELFFQIFDIVFAQFFHSSIFSCFLSKYLEC